MSSDREYEGRSFAEVHIFRSLGMKVLTLFHKLQCRMFSVFKNYTLSEVNISTRFYSGTSL